MDDWAEVQQLAIHDRAGKLINQWGAVAASSLDVSQLASSIYVLSITYTNGGVTTHSFIKP